VPYDAVRAKVDVAIVMESTYPYLKGGVSAVVHDIVTQNTDLTFGIIHITWDSQSASEDLYGVPANVRWIHTIFLSIHEHRNNFMQLTPKLLRMRNEERAELAHRLFDALAAIPAGDTGPMWTLYDEGMNPLTRRYPVWALLGSQEFMDALQDRLPGLGLPLTEAFWLIRDFFSLSYALLNETIPQASVYHAHTTGYASLVGVSAARQHGAAFLLTEHNLYVRDTVNTLLGRNMALPVTSTDWRNFDVTPRQRPWMAWWIEMGRFCYPSADHVTYLYPDAIAEARALGAPTNDSVVSVIPNGMVVESFDKAYAQRLQAIQEILLGGDRIWRLAYIARVVPIKGLREFIESARILLDRGVTNWHLDVLGPTDHVPSVYYQGCLDKIDDFGLGGHFTFRGTVDVRAMIGDFDVLVLPSYNEGQPIVVLEAMTAGIPTVGTAVGGMPQLVAERLTHQTGRSWDAGGVLVDPANLIHGVADALQDVLADLDGYEQLAKNARGRVEDFFQLHDAMAMYNQLYRRLGARPMLAERPALGPAAPTVTKPVSPDEHGRHVNRGPERGRQVVVAQAVGRVTVTTRAVGRAAVVPRPD
jgi:glycosyltransferase involved in cell wall biosynthesis